MDTIRKTRYLSTLCGIGSHRYCLEAINEHCQCSCHFEESFSSELIGGLGYQLWQLAADFNLMEESVRRDHIISIIRSAQGKLDFHGFSAEEIYELFQPTLARDYWSLRETYEDFGLNFLDRYRKG